jgi:DNA-binding Lrp family transcriptional regulator
MKKNGVSRGTTVLLNPRSLGYECIASFGIRVDYPHVTETIEFLKRFPEIVFCTSSMGRHNIFAIAALRNVGLLGQLKENIKRNPMIEEATTSIWVDEILLCPENFEFQLIK